MTRLYVELADAESAQLFGRDAKPISESAREGVLLDRDDLRAWDAHGRWKCKCDACVRVRALLDEALFDEADG